MKEKSQQLKELIHLHQKQKERIQDYEDILYKAVQFHQVKEKVGLVMGIWKTSVLFFYYLFMCLFEIERDRECDQ